MTEENTFSYLGLLDKKTHYVPCVGVIDFFWSLRPDTRKKVLKGWIDTLQKIYDTEDFEPEIIAGNMLLFPNEDIVEEKESTNVVQFPSISRNL